MAQQKKAPAGARKAAAPKNAARTATKSVPAAEAAPVLADAMAAPLEAITKAVQNAVELTAVEAVMAPATRILGAGADRALEAYEQVKNTSEQVQQTFTEAASATTRGAIEVNGKVIDAWRAQSDIALELWRQAFAAPSVAEAIRLQTSGARQAYETAATHWRDLAETTGRWFGASVQPMQRAFGAQTR